MNVIEKIDEIPSLILQETKQTKHYRHIQHGRLAGQKDGQPENSIRALCGGMNMHIYKSHGSIKNYKVKLL